MEKKIGTIVLGIVVISIISVIGAFMLYPIFVRGEYWMFHFYIRVFLCMFLVMLLAVLRLYNAIVQNTRFVIKLREAMIRMQQAFPSLQRAITNLGISVNSAKDAVKDAKKAIDMNTDETEEVKELLNRIRQNAKAKTQGD